MPEGRRIGKLGTSLWRRIRAATGLGGDAKISIDTIISLNDELFKDHLHRTAEKMTIKEVPTVYIHGYANTFENAVVRAAQIGFDLGFGQGIGLFEWPSRGAWMSYAADETAAELSKYALAEFLTTFVRASACGKINVIAHSMGCRVLLNAMEVLAGKQSDVLQSIEQVIFAAADVDAAIMPHLGKHAVDNCGRATAYVSGEDKALQISKWLHKFPRVGIAPPTFVMSGMDTILVHSVGVWNESHYM